MKSQSFYVKLSSLSYILLSFFAIFSTAATYYNTTHLPLLTTENTSNSLLICGNENPTFLFFDFSTAPPLLFYSYIPIVLSLIFFSFFIIKADKNGRRSWRFFAFSASFALWTTNILVQWVASYHTVLMFAWQMTALLEILVYVSGFNFLISFVELPKKFLLIKNILFSVLIFLIAVLLPTHLNITSYDLVTCEGIVGLLWVFLYYVIEPIFILSILFVLGYTIIFKKDFSKKDFSQIRIQSIGLFGFLSIFWVSNVAGEITNTYEINLIGPLGLFIFIGLHVYTVVRYNIYKTKLLATQVFVYILFILIASLLLVVKSPYARAISSLTLILVGTFGALLIKSVKREVAQKEEIEKLAKRLSKANKHLKVLDKMKSEFVSIASHQLRSPLTTIKGYTSMLLEGSFGVLSKKTEQAVLNISEATKYMSLSVEDYLNVSRIEAGNMKYEYSKFSLRELAEKMVDEMRPIALKKGLALIYRSRCDDDAYIRADIGKTRQIILNLIDNALKYTEKGSITVLVSDNRESKEVTLSVIDTGVGMSVETKKMVFDKFVRAINANEINVTGTGLGLFVAKQMMTDMGGKIDGVSEGEGQGSCFSITFPDVS